MSQIQHWRLAITPLSPVHLGTGQDYQPTAYVIDDGVLYAFDGIAALNALSQAERDRLGRMLEGRLSADRLWEVQRFFYDNRRRLAAVSRHQVRVNQTVEAFYRERVGQIVQHEHGGGKVQNKLEIERTAFNPPSGEAILPGSGLKGAIRTALLDVLNDGQSLPRELERDGRANQKLQERLFTYQMRELERDPMRLVGLADAALRYPANFATEVRFAVNRKKQPVQRDGRLVESQAEQKGLYQLLECLPALQPRALTGGLSIQSTDGVESDKWPRYRFRLAEIAAACNRFYRPILERELNLLRERGYVDEDWRERIETAFAGPLSAALEQNHAWLLRVGRHSGAESVTLNGVRRIKIMKGRGERPEYLDGAKTLWLASDERLAQRGLLPFGWLLVEPYQDEKELAAWDGTDYASPLAQWKAALTERQTLFRAELEDAERKEAQRREAEIAARKAAAAEAGRLANLSDEARKVEAIRTLLARDRTVNRKEPGGELANNLIELLREASEHWSGPECRNLADLALEVHAFIGWPKKEKKQKRQQLIDAVRSRAS